MVTTASAASRAMPVSVATPTMMPTAPQAMATGMALRTPSVMASRQSPTSMTSDSSESPRRTKFTATGTAMMANSHQRAAVMCGRLRPSIHAMICGSKISAASTADRPTTSRGVPQMSTVEAIDQNAAKNGARPSKISHSSTTIGMSRCPRLSITSFTGVSSARSMPDRPLRSARRCT
ncbi:hypothetical protein KBTX_04401 [wastewater metagenome]|uniref:Uncharacterized protein n=2 Tax=unclassified sequences TaxID=12908 RepID=A0A5B8RIZ2_9ZZZZ|nr:hypothetical protein KBTEX_04401 [uncultured organism]